jgi:hypothetical protein
LHDLRRTCRTLMSHHRVEFEIAELAIGDRRTTGSTTLPNCGRPAATPLRGGPITASDGPGAGDWPWGAYFKGMEQQQAKPGTLRSVVLVAVPLFAILAAAFWYAASAWLSVSGPPMPTTGYVALALGLVFSLLVGCGLMALLFYSSRHGYDEPYEADESDPPLS